jgi:hypothetical protein
LSGVFITDHGLPMQRIRLWHLKDKEVRLLTPTLALQQRAPGPVIHPHWLDKMGCKPGLMTPVDILFHAIPGQGDAFDLGRRNRRRIAPQLSDFTGWLNVQIAISRARTAR